MKNLYFTFLKLYNRLKIKILNIKKEIEKNVLIIAQLLFCGQLNYNVTDAITIESHQYYECENNALFSIIKKMLFINRRTKALVSYR